MLGVRFEREAKEKIKHYKENKLTHALSEAIMTEQETKKQHYLPFAYLKYFRIDPKVSNREHAKILRDDGVNVTEELVANQCYKKWFYRKKETKESECGFQKFEEDWDTTVKNTRAGANENSLIFMQMILYHFRNLSIQYLTAMDRYDAVSAAVKTWIENKVLKLPKGVEFTDDDSHIHNFPWDVNIVRMGGTLLTSDNPSVMAIPPTQDGYAPFFLPISPSELLVAIDKTKYKFMNLVGSAQDAVIANAFVASQGLRHVYYHKKMPPNLRTDLWKMIERNRQPKHSRGKFEGSRFKPGHVIFGTQERHNFTFLKVL
jgi:uncharacterized protein YnzC (UPF0291/DUF896 family)